VGALFSGVADVLVAGNLPVDVAGRNAPVSEGSTIPKLAHPKNPPGKLRAVTRLQPFCARVASTISVREAPMRPFAALIERSAKFREPEIPGARLERAHPPAVHRLDEGIRELFDYACITNDLEAATDLVALMEKWHARRSYDDDEQQRMGGIYLKRMHGELHRRHITLGTRPAARPNPDIA
jgi:hypothetical protein